MTSNDILRKIHLYLFAFCVGLAFFLGLAYGFFAYRFHLPPYRYFLSNYLHVHNKIYPDDPILQVDIDKLISIDGKDGVDKVRGSLVEILWDESLPGRSDVQLAKISDEERYTKFYPVVERIEQLTVQMEFGLDSKMHLFHPKSSNGDLVIYHQGHTGDFLAGESTIRGLLGKGYSVLAASMPLLGLNSQPIVDLPNIGKFRLTKHNQLEYLKPKKGSSLKYFVEPLVVALNYLHVQSDFRKIHVVGISGGGWTAMLLAALDSRVEKSFSVAGSEPFFTASVFPTEYEQRAYELYSRINYLTLYTLGSVGHGRKHVQIYNRYDPCCYRGEYASLYEPVVLDKIGEIGSGHFVVLLDDTHTEHKISSFALGYILSELDRK